MNSHRIVFLLFAFPAFAGEPATLMDAKSPITPAPASPGPWRIGAGVMWRNVGELSVDPNFQSSRFADRFFAPPAGAGWTNTFANRTYDDGFVNIGAATIVSELTTYWGYQNDSQVSNGSLNYALGGGSAQSFPGSGRDDQDPASAPYLEFSYLRPIRPGFVAGFTANLSLASLDGRTTSTMNQSSVSMVDRYALGGVIPPSAPYTGSFAGPGPLIYNPPTSREFILSPDGTGHYHFAHDTDLYNLAFGGEIQWQPAESWYFGVGIGTVLNLADWSASWSMPVPATTGTAMIGGADRGAEFLWGLYLKSSAGYRINEHWSLEGFFRYDWNETLSDSVSPSSFELGLSGWSAALGVSYRF